MFVLELTRETTAPTNATVGAGHVGDGGAGLRGFEAIRLRHHVRDLIATPAVSLNSNRVFGDEALVDDGLDSRQNAFQSARPGIARRVDNVRHENQIAVADVERRVDRSTRTGI